MKMIKDVRFIVLIALILLSTYFVVSPMIFKKSGVVVSFVQSDADCTNVQTGGVVTTINGLSVTDISSFDEIVRQIKSGEFVTLISNNEPASCIAIMDSDIGFNVKDVPNTNLKFGIEIAGGTRVLLKPDISDVSSAQIEETATILRERINLFGLSDIRVSPIGSNLIQLEASGLSGDDIQNFLAKQGKFEGLLVVPIDFGNGVSNIIVDGNNYPVSLVDSKLAVNNSLFDVNQSFELDNVKFRVYNVTNNSIVVLAEIFSGADIVNVFTDPQYGGVAPVGDGYRFSFTVQVTKESADRFGKATEGQPTYFSGDESYIIPKLALFLDEQPVSTLNIVSSLAGQSLTTPSIQGFGATSEEAINEMLRLQTILRSGSLPITLSIERVDTITQSEGSDLINSTIIVALVSAVVVSAVIFVRYRDFRISVPMLLLSFSEILLILGVAASQLMAALVVIGALFVGIYSKSIHGVVGWVSVILMALVSGFVVANAWTLDIPAIAGLIAVLGVSVNQMIIITDQLMEKEKDLASKHKTALEIVTNSASMVTFAMLPLVFIGVGTLRGFAITTVVGILIGFLLTRPAYMLVLERIKKLGV